MKSDFDDITAGVRWVWFDLDDTLIDFHANSRIALRMLYERENLSRFYPSPEAWIEAYERHNHSLWDRYSKGEITQDFLRVDRFASPLSAGWRGSRVELETFSRMLDPEYLDLLARQKNLIDGAEEVLDLLHDHKYNIGVLSNGFTEVQNQKLLNTGLCRKVDLMVLSDDIGVNKPDVRLFQHAMTLTSDQDPRHHMMIGDNPSTDIAGGRAAGWRTVLLDTTSDGIKLTDGTLVIPSLRNLFFLKW